MLMTLTIHPPALDNGAQRVVIQIVQCEPNGDHGELDLVFLVDLAPSLRSAGSRSQSCGEPEQIILDSEHGQSSHSMKRCSCPMKWCSYPMKKSAAT
jgi:hypothetical protein